MIKKAFNNQRLRFFTLGAFVVLAAVFLMGMDAPSPNYGRYQISAWGDTAAHGAFIVDTATGETKIAYRYKETAGERVKERNNLGKNFSSIE
ncbi:MAG: hypothetical protein JEZ11_09440 [Desulfobacterales bacterium]|nr:hypothetical protein [Desulfobacterales bacterium]